MKYDFPIIENISDVLPAIEGRKDFVVGEKEGGFTVVNYLVSLPDTFDCNIRRECRGIKFDTATGAIIQRPFHKFFNVGEREETAPNLIDVESMYIEVKHDGSMIAPIILPENDSLRLTTKMGINPISMQAETFIADKPDYLAFCRGLLEHGKTPIFEWCSRKNRIVLDYPEDRLLLLAIRDNVTGNYEEAFYEYGIVPSIEYTPPQGSDYLKEIKEDGENIEGAVLVCPKGHRVKIKSEWYVNLHRVKSEISYEHNLIQVILENRLDDLLPIMDADLKDKVNEFSEQFFKGVTELADKYDALFNMHYTDDRKEFAAEVKDLKGITPSIMFKMYDGMDAYEALLFFIRKNCLKNEKWLQFKQQIGLAAVWTGGMFSDD